LFQCIKRHLGTGVQFYNGVTLLQVYFVDNCTSVIHVLRVQCDWRKWKSCLISFYKEADTIRSYSPLECRPISTIKWAYKAIQGYKEWFVRPGSKSRANRVSFY